MPLTFSRVYFPLELLSLEYRNLGLVRGHVCLDEPERYTGRSLVLLVGSPMLDRSGGRGYTKNDPWNSRSGVQLTDNNRVWLKNTLVTETETGSAKNFVAVLRSSGYDRGTKLFLKFVVLKKVLKKFIPRQRFGLLWNSQIVSGVENGL